MITLETSLGPISIELDTKNTPNTAANFLKHAKSGFYNGTIFHRVIDGFMIQGGGFESGMMQKETDSPIKNEADMASSNLRGTIAMARTSNPHSATTQFFINVSDNAFLNHTSKSVEGWGYCVFGRVVEGMDVVDKIKSVSTTSRAGHQDVPEQDVVIEKVSVSDDE